ncbi:MAG TPA: YigZ family protein [Candidatus Tenderia electrophaga]|uniref:YigZ family protein n=1 Tax=Candidatus Tenderia electrophaga TaxID=1748243 RepID=A0A832N549_9GAMM|nr:YigZ family protein [Candidatus Tenderia electrophaga]
MSDVAYPTPAQSMQAEIEVKKSRFIARASKVSDRQGAMAFVEQSRLDYPDARHHCWAYLLGNPASASSAAANDAGEPSGTAGKPILNVIQHKGVGDVIVVVIRYFGGIKLGAGGLVRAYSGAAEAVMSMLPLEQAVPMQVVSLSLDFAKEQLLRHWVGQHEALILNVDYAQQVLMQLSVPDVVVGELTAFCAAQSITRLP